MCVCMYACLCVCVSARPALHGLLLHELLLLYNMNVDFFQSVYSVCVKRYYCSDSRRGGETTSERTILWRLKCSVFVQPHEELVRQLVSVSSSVHCYETEKKKKETHRFTLIIYYCNMIINIVIIQKCFTAATIVSAKQFKP